jgi:nucleoporin POM34
MSFENSSFAKSLYVAGTPGRYNTRFTPSNSFSQALSSQAFSVTPGKTNVADTSSSGINKLVVNGSASDQSGMFGSSSGLAYNQSPTNSVSRLQLKQFSAMSSTQESSPNALKADASSWSIIYGNPSKTPEAGNSRFIASKPSTILPSSEDGNTSMSIVAARMSFNGTLPVTPNAALPPKPTTVPTGNWEHPCLETIRNRTFDKKEAVRKVLFNMVAYLVLHKTISLFLSQYARAESYLGSLESYSVISENLIFLLRLVFIYNIVWNAYKLLKPADTFEDLPLTASQRKLLGLPESSKAIDPSKAITPPKYLKSTVPNRYYYAGPGPLKSSSSTTRTTPKTNSIFTKAAIAPDSPVAGLYQKLRSPFAGKPQQLPAPEKKELPSASATSAARALENTSNAFVKTPVSQPGNSTLSGVAASSTNSTLAIGANTSTPVTNLPAESSFSQNSSFEPSARYLYMAKKSSRAF